MSGENAAILSSSDASQQSSYEPVRVLGKGAFGEAVLYRKVEDNTLVVWKEIDLNRLSEKERRESQNEIEILSMLNHPNVISYYNHFLDGETLLIEMEYANGGSLYEKIGYQEQPFTEDTVTTLFYQVLLALEHIHEYGILHRDIKAMNIFLTRAGLVKLGDFGISKVLDSQKAGAQTVVGTPYYMSPELVKGEVYNEKSDIWAAGCVLYELLTLSRVFEATNLLRMAAEIVKSDMDKERIPDMYSSDLVDLVSDMLSKSAKDRPTAKQARDHASMASIAKVMDKKIFELNVSTQRARESVTNDIIPVVTNKSSDVFCWGAGKRSPQRVEQFQKGKAALQLAVGKNHFCVVTVEKDLFTWTNSMASQQGQLGHGDKASYRSPKKVEALDNVHVKQAACGEDFTLCITDEGALYSWGSNYFGGLGDGGTNGGNVCSPRILDFFTEIPVRQVACGDSHVMVLTKNNEIYSWGCGELGRLGLGDEDDYDTPQRVTLRGGHDVRTVEAGTDCSFIVKVNGRVLGCGSNECNKLGLNATAQGLRKRKAQLSYDLQCKLKFATITLLNKYSIVSVSSGHSHTAAIDMYGHLLMFGSNKFGQLGVGDFRPRAGVCQVAGPLAGKFITRASCGDSYTVIATRDNQLYSCGQSADGRLGISHIDKGRGPGSSCFAYPRPIFGSLHAVSDLVSSYWSSLVIAEQVLKQKTITSHLSNPLMSPYGTQVSTESDGVFADDESSSRPGSADSRESRSKIITNPRDASLVPEWLKNELDDSEFIPVESSPEPETEPRTKACGTTAKTEARNTDILQKTNDSEPVTSAVELAEEETDVAPVGEKSVAELRARVAKLEVENHLLKTRNEQLEKQVDEQREIINGMSDKVLG